MSRIVWGALGEKTYEAGVDRGVLYIGTSAGVPWNGLVSVTEAPTGGESKDYYMDGTKYLNLVGSEEFGATVEAYTYPQQFAQCDGTAKVKHGLYASQQNRVPFNMSYRSSVGNDVDGIAHGYKINLVYNASAKPSSRTRSTIGESVEASLFNWELSTRPTSIPGFNATAHFSIDSRETPVELMTQLETILYGSDSTPARMPTGAELVQLFNTFVSVDPDAPVTEQPDETIDSGAPDPVVVTVYDGGSPATVATTTMDGGTP